MIGDWEKSLEWKYGIKFLNKEIIHNGFLMTFALTDMQREQVLSQENMFETIIIETLMKIAESTNRPVSQQDGTVDITENRLVLSGSRIFIDAILLQLFGQKNR